MSTLTERLIAILDRERGGVPEEPVVSVPEACYEIGTVFYKKHYPRNDRAAILVMAKANEAILICVPSGNRWDDQTRLTLGPGPGVTKEEFHRAFGDDWEVSRRGKEALAEWARTDV